jgi:hypothetical protein
MSTVPIYVSFGRGLTQDKLIDWPKRVTLTSNFGLQEGNDRFKWNFDGTFSLHSTYLHRLDNTAPYRNKGIWKLKIPLKIKIFLWLLNKKVILTKDNLARRTGRPAKGVVFVIIMRQYNIFSLTALMLERFSAYFSMLQVYPHPDRYHIC